MAAIISQIAANKRARAKAQHLAVASDKCVYEIPPFDPCFDPLVHNKVSQKWVSLKSILLIGKSFMAVSFGSIQACYRVRATLSC